MTPLEVRRAARAIVERTTRVQQLPRTIRDPRVLAAIAETVRNANRGAS